MDSKEVLPSLQLLVAVAKAEDAIGHALTGWPLCHYLHALASPFMLSLSP